MLQVRPVVEGQDHLSPERARIWRPDAALAVIAIPPPQGLLRGSVAAGLGDLWGALLSRQALFDAGVWLIILVTASH